jgi:sortase A
MGQHTIGAVFDPPPPPPAERQRTVGDNIRTGLRGLGQTLITFGLVVLLFVVYEVYVTTWFTHREQHKLKIALQHEFATGQDPLEKLPDGSLPNLKVGAGIANIYIPRLGRDFAWTIVEGTSDADLNKGPGHYVGTALPGAIGNFAVAGHRVGKGEPFLNLDHLKPGDTVIIETETSWFVYKVKGAPTNISAKDADGIPGREIVSSLDGDPLYPVPDHPGLAPTEHLITLTTCHPKFSASHRMIVYGALQNTVPQTTNFTMPAAVQALYNSVVT